MGMTHQEAARIAARLTPNLTVTTDKPTRGHGRGKLQPADKTDIGLRGVPVIGHGSGAISGTAPGGELGAAARLERAGRELVQNHLAREARRRMNAKMKPSDRAL